MKNDCLTSTMPSAFADVRAQWDRVVRRRSFLRGLGVMGAALPVTALSGIDASAAVSSGRTLTHGDAAILRFLAAAELLESDLWTQYNELGGVSGGNAAYVAALQNLDGDMPQYITDNTDDELSHAAFLNAYLHAHGAHPVDLDAFRTLPGSSATGSTRSGRLTNLLSLDVDTSWYTRYRSDQNPDLGGTFAQAVAIHGEPAVPLNDTDTPPGGPQPNPPVTTAARRMQAIANTAAFHFAMIEQGGSSLYTTMALKVTSLEVLRIVVSIGGVEVNHFAIWHDKAGNAVSGSLAGLTDPETGVTFPDLNNPGGELAQTNKIMPEPCAFLSAGLPACSVIRPSTVANAGAMAAVGGLTATGLFTGQSAAFFDTIVDLAEQADAAHRQT
jgi:Ferritin-like domain